MNEEENGKRKNIGEEGGDQKLSIVCHAIERICEWIGYEI